MRKSAKWYYIYGQIEEVIANAMIEEGKASMLPGSVGLGPLNESERAPKFSIVVPSENIEEFKNRIIDLRA